MADKQHAGAQQILTMIVQARRENRMLTDPEVAERMGRKHAEGRAVASMCDLLDAAAAHAGVPLLAIVTVLSAKREINKQAWVKEYGDLREKIFERSRNHVFTEQDYHLIRGALDDLAPRGTKLAWASVNEKYPLEILFGRLTGNDLADDRRTNDAIEDLGTDDRVERQAPTGQRRSVIGAPGP